ncbi:hypothetical protein [Patulibacter sp.]|uniref:hypothetical protein n=1 Tax=Patulibacter sp. TaxID=1912859 RepID=UPI0027177EF7|nr:hypothetical protein [Patulibacter sp.]MDO9407327.1 hypothetical protein [Patulibacter sp.]
MFATTTRPIAIPQPHAAPTGAPPGPGAVRRIRVTRRTVVRTHRTRRTAVLPAARADSYLVRLQRPTGQGVPSVVRIAVMAPHRARVGR